MEARVLIFLVLSFAIVVSYPFLLERMGVAPPPAVEQPADVPDAGPNIAPAPPTQPTDPASAAVPPRVPGPEQTVTVETDLYLARLSTHGANVRQWQLKRFDAPADDGPQPIELYQPAAGHTPPLTLLSASRPALAEANYALEGPTALRLGAARPAGEVAFHYQDADGTRIEKRLRFRNDSYLIEIEVRGDTVAPLVLSSGTNFGITTWGGADFVGFIGPVTRIGEEIIKDKPGNIDGELERKGAISWSALQDKYFISAVIPERAELIRVRKQNEQAVALELPLTLPAKVQVYAGPKEYERLARTAPDLEETIDFGWFIYGSWGLVRAIAKPLFYVLRWFHDFTYNWGVAIILLTVLIKSIFIPLTHKGYLAMKRMQELQPQMVALQKKYKDNKEKLNRELMELYRTHKVNPLGGCLPMIVQIPFFVALFNILYTTIELRQAPFMLWVDDLSSPDPFYVLPIIMGGSMALQQKMQPTTMDPMQARLMMLLPVVFTFLFLNFPSGLVLYWLTNNVLTISQQYITKKYFEKPAAEAEAEHEPGKRRG